MNKDRSDIIDPPYHFSDEENARAESAIARMYARIMSNKVESLFEYADEIKPLGKEKHIIRRWEK